ncbi:MAG TPA: hypothetical protein VGS02_00570 [Acidobacteriaceae bacterium]|nr:hypothetical protein [Acidobacteriaceae bacterium]
MPHTVRLHSLLTLLLFLAAPAVRAQNVPPAAACPSTPTLDKLIVALDAAVSGPANKDRTCMRQLLLPEARLIPLSPAGTMRVLTLDDWIAAVAKRGADAFYEVQIRHPSDSYGRIAQLWSTYEIRPTPEGKPEARGINSIQAVFDGQNWKVVEILWQAETPQTPIPARYLP